MEITDLALKILKADTVQAPVVESTENMLLVGIVSVVDILRKLLIQRSSAQHKYLGEIYTKNVVTCTYDEFNFQSLEFDG